MATTAPKAGAFPSPYEIETPAGCEGWEEMYPYYALFDERRREIDENRFWFWNSMHFPMPMPAFDVICIDSPYQAVGSWQNRVFAVPPAMGIDYRCVNGYIYISGNPVTDPAKIAERAEFFQARAGYYFQNWTELYGKWRAKMEALIGELGELQVPDLPEYEPDEVAFGDDRNTAFYEVLDAYGRALRLGDLMWQHHFEFLLLGYGAYMTFFAFCKKAFPEIADQTIARMVAGIEAEIFRPDEEVRRLARRAVELGVDNEFKEERTAQSTMAALEKRGPAGRTWLDELATSRDPWFNINVGDGFYHYHRSWNDDLSMPFAGIPGYIAQIKKGESIERPLGKLQEQRAQLIKDYRELLGSDEERAAYDQMIALAHRVFPYVEGHKFYCEHWYTNLFFNKIREFGALLAANGFFAREDDVFQLTHYELEAAIIDLMTAWSNGSPPRGPEHWPQIVSERRAAIAEWAKHSTPPALGPVPDVIDDPAIVMLWGITRESLDRWLRAGSDVASRELRGFAASSGVVEGPACVVRSVDEIARVRKGDILVCQVTNPTWAPLFQKIAGAVSDIGGSMSHAAIVAREFGLPAVVGTGTATTLIKDGQRIRVDGGRGIVTLLS